MNSFEELVLGEIFERNEKPLRWNQFTLEGLRTRIKPLLAAVSDFEILVLSGDNSAEDSNGLTFDPETKQVEQ